ncbi:hypothetical protein RHGRI_038497 [Rhododendron griersonianum]|uniref:Uncharacterized protein n=1 Tax=Rhododendron griersonianum TaxID=479676 RepID=A0AAV6HN35_9ERIC|nr:hypothetical protein RHGRI_038497 [Rhododendron griersonianum]
MTAPEASTTLTMTAPSIGNCGVCDGAGGCTVGDRGGAEDEVWRRWWSYSLVRDDAVGRDAQAEELPERLFRAVRVCLVEMSAAMVVDRVVRERMRSAFVERFWD